MALKIYKMDSSPGVRAVLMMAELLKLNYVQEDLDVYGGEHMTPEYLQKNPLHSVPLLQDGDFYLADSHAIITYLVSKYGADQQATLYPCEVSLRATVDQRLFFDTSILYPISKKIVRAMIPTYLQREAMNDAYEIMEKYLEKTKYLAADHLTVADVSCIATVSSAAVLVPVMGDTFPKLKAWLSRLEEEDWYKKGNLFGLNKMKEALKSMGWDGMSS